MSKRLLENPSYYTNEPLTKHQKINHNVQVDYNSDDYSEEEMDRWLKDYEQYEKSKCYVCNLCDVCGYISQIPDKYQDCPICHAGVFDMHPPKIVCKCNNKIYKE